MPLIGRQTKMRAFKLLLLLGFIFVAVESGSVQTSSNASAFNESLADLVADPSNSVVEETSDGVKLLSGGTVKLVLANRFLDVGVNVQSCIGK